jgi:nucleoredoxin
MALQKLLGVDKLVSKSGEIDTATLEGKTLMIYFSAHWCPPCRGFTPKLAQFYKNLRDAGRTDFEIVFVSGDRSEEEFDSYYKESHPWLALPWAASKANKALNKHFKVEGIPSLCVVDSEGCTITTEGDDKVREEDPEGKNFPNGWKPKSTYEILADAKMTTKDGKPLTVADLKKTDAFALYFSAHWCPPCRGFTPVLAKLYNKMKADGRNMEFVFVSSDKDEAQYTDYHGEMPWAAMSFKDPQVSALKSLCKVNGIPSLATFKGSDGSMINANARGAAGGDEEGKDFPWEKKPLPPCSTFAPRDDVIEALNGEMCVVLTPGSADDASTAAFTKAAEKNHADAKARGEEPDVYFFIVRTEEGKDLYGRVLQVLKQEAPQEGKPSVLSFNLPNDRANSEMSGEITMESVLDHVATFKKTQLC